jgi:hypothetical protein
MVKLIRTKFTVKKNVEQKTVGVPWDTAQPGQACTLNVASSKTNTRMHRGAARQDACKERWRPSPPLRTNKMCFSLAMQAENAAELKHIVDCKADANRDRAQCMHAVNSCIKHESHAPAACQDNCSSTIGAIASNSGNKHLPHKAKWPPARATCPHSRTTRVARKA